MKLYDELASWWPLLSPPEEYAEEAEFLELGSGGGSNASHLKEHFELTLVDRSRGMLEVSRRLNPQCEHSELEPGAHEIFVAKRPPR